MAKSNLKLNLESLKDRKEWKRHPVNQGDNVYRILPPFGENADGYAYRRWTIAWLSDPQTGRRRPYATPRSFGEDACPVAEYISEIEKKREKLETALKERGASKEEMKEQLKPLNDIIWNIKPKVIFTYNACNKAGEVGLLELKKTAHDAMKKQMMQYVTDYGQDPTSLCSDQDDSGVWFKITREGEGTNTEYSVSKNQSKKKTSEGLVWVDDRDPLPTNVSDNYDNLAYDLSTIYKRHSYEDLKQVLQANLTAICEQHPIAKVKGFDTAQPQLKKLEKVEEELEEYKAPIKKPLNIKFDDDEDEAPKAKSTSKTQATKQSSKNQESEDEIFAFAESLLDD